MSGCGNEAEELGLARRRVADRGQPLEVELAGRDGDARLAQRRTGQQVACLDVRAGRHREEQLAVGEPQDRFEPAKELEIGVGQGHGGQLTASSAGSASGRHAG